MLNQRQLLGLRGEQAAATWLEQHGWQILARRFRAGHRDIDLVAAQYSESRGERLIAFVEVRTRSTTDFVSPIETVRYRKQAEVRRAARSWIASNKRFQDTYRFDFVGVTVEGPTLQIEHIPNAF